MGIFNRLKKTIKNGCSIRIGPYLANFRINRASRNLDDFYFRQILFLRSKYPVLQQMEIPTGSVDDAKVFQFL